MTRWGMALDLKRCVGCNACTVACKQENGTPRGVFFTKTVSEEVGHYPNATRIYTPLICNHCSDAPCLNACPTGATYQTDEGLILVDDDKCIGCRACYVACPYKHRTYLSKDNLDKNTWYPNHVTAFEKSKLREFQAGTVVKCSFCEHRLAEGKEPACVITCPAVARIFGDLDDPNSEVRREIARRDGYQPLAELGTDPSVFYLE